MRLTSSLLLFGRHSRREFRLDRCSVICAVVLVLCSLSGQYNAAQYEPDAVLEKPVALDAQSLRSWRVPKQVLGPYKAAPIAQLPLYFVVV